MILLDLLLIQVVCVLIIDVLGAVDDMLTPLVRKLTGSKVGKIGKPLSCSTCMTWWLGLIWIIVMGQFTLPLVAYLLGLASLTGVTYLMIRLVQDVATKIIGFIYDVFGL